MAREDPTLTSRLVAEAFGTFILTFSVFANVIGGSGPVFTALSIASTLMVAIYALGECSGAHLNPAVSVAISLCQQQKWSTTGYYVTAQLLGSASAAAFAFGAYGMTFKLEPGAGHSIWAAGACETLFTCLLCFVVLNCACAKANAGNQYFGLAIGYTIIAGGFAAGAVSGANLNPAISFAIDASSLSLYHSLAYCGFQLAGAALAAGLYKTCRPLDLAPSHLALAPAGTTEKLCAEGVGAFFLTLTASLNVAQGVVSAALSIAAALTSLIYAVGSVSGAHLNPAVTLAIVFSKRSLIEPREAVRFISVQILGAIAGACTAAAILSSSGRKTTFPIAPPVGKSWVELAIAETLFTAVLCLAVLTVATSVTSQSKDFFGLAIGACVAIGGFAGSSLGAGVLNPAVAVGFDTAHSLLTDSKFLNSLLYSLMEVAGAGIASGVFYVTHTQDYAVAEEEGKVV
ncbi:unnamed protein product [Amoebophrya sp. A25]|nr:unnamed protein product [Amoebophrya sp. A25]|eukprot:GSA25T00012022001.1